MSIAHLLTSNSANSPPSDITVNNLKIEGKSSDQLSEFIVGAGTEYRYDTIQSAINDALGTNNVIIVTPGTYTENLDLKTGGFSIIGVASADTLFGSSVIINGSITGNITAETRIANLAVNAISDAITIMSSTNFLTINGCTLLSSGGSILIINNAYVFIQNTRFRTAGSSAMINATSNSQVVLISNVVDTDSPQNKILGFSDNTFCIAIGNLFFDMFSFNTNSTGLIVNNSILIGDFPAYTIDGTSIAIVSNNLIFSNSGLSTDWVVGSIGAGSIISGSNSLLGRNTIGAGITYVPMTIA